MIVVDASAGLAALLNAGPARAALADQQLHVPHLVDAELANVLRRKVAGGVLADADGRRALDTWRRLGMTRHPLVPLLARMWELRDTVSAYDATYVALAEALACPLLTADGRLGRAPGTRLHGRGRARLARAGRSARQGAGAGAGTAAATAGARASAQKP